MVAQMGRRRSTNPQPRGKVLAITLLVLCSLLTVVFPGQAMAHASLVSASPSPGARLSDAPGHLDLQFASELEQSLTRIQVLNNQGELVSKGRSIVFTTDGKGVGIDLPTLPNGVYSVLYSVTPTDDGHTLEGRYAFSVGLLDQALNSRVEVNDASSSPLNGIAQGAFLAVTLSLVGLIFFLEFIWVPLAGYSPALHRGLRWCAFGLASIAFVSGIWSLGAYITAASGQSLGISVLTATVLKTTVGRLMLIRLLLALILASLAGVWWRMYWRWATLTLAVALVCVTGLQGHGADTGSPLVLLSRWAHLGAAALWAGGLAGFAIVVWPHLRSLPPEERHSVRSAAVRRFGIVAALSIAVLAVTGAYAAAIQLPDLRALVDTAYGRALTVKLSVFAVALGFGAYHALRKGGARFQLTVAVEAGLALILFAAVGFLTTNPPARVVRESQQQANVAESAPFQVQLQWPGPQTSLQRSPRGIDLRFTQGLNPALSDITVLAASGERVSGTRKGIDSRNGWMWLTLPELPEGKYTVQWTALSSTGQPLQGNWDMSVPPGGSLPLADPTALRLIGVGLALSLVLGIALFTRLQVFRRSGKFRWPEATLMAAVVTGVAALVIGTTMNAPDRLRPISVTIPTGVEPAGETVTIRIQFPTPVFRTSGVRLLDDSGVRVHPGTGAPVAGNPSIWELRVPALRPGSYRLEWDSVSGYTAQRSRGAYSLDVKDVRRDNIAGVDASHANQHTSEGATPEPPRVHTPLSDRVVVQSLSPFLIETIDATAARSLFVWLATCGAVLLTGYAGAAWILELQLTATPSGHRTGREQRRIPARKGARWPLWVPAGLLALEGVDLLITWLTLSAPAFNAAGVGPGYVGPWQTPFGLAWMIRVMLLIGALILQRRRSGASTVFALTLGALIVRGASDPLVFGGLGFFVILTQLLLMGSAGLICAARVWVEVVTTDIGRLAERRGLKLGWVIVGTVVATAALTLSAFGDSMIASLAGSWKDPWALLGLVASGLFLVGGAISALVQYADLTRHRDKDSLSRAGSGDWALIHPRG